MDLGHFLRVLWARKLVVLIALVSCMAGGIVMIVTTPKRYEAHTQVQLDLIKPDPVSGFHVNSKNSDAYVAAQIQDIRDFQVASKAAEAIGWLDNPDLQAAYTQLPPGTNQDFPHWVAQRIIEGTSVQPVQDSNILLIKFHGSSPEMARVVAQAIREAYVNNMSENQAALAQKTLPAYKAQAEQARVKLSELETRRSQMERETGVILQDSGVDLDSSRLRQMASTTPKTISLAADQPSEKLSNLLAQTDSAIQQSTRELGPNNPQLIALKQRRATLATQIAQQGKDRSSVADVTRLRAKQIDSDLTSQTAKVIGQSEKVSRLRLLQDEINMQQQRYSTASAAAGQATQRLEGGGGNVTPVGLTEGPNDPVYPNRSLVMGGTGALGLMAGSLLAMLSELFDRRVRTEADLAPIVPGTRIAVVPLARLPGARRFPGLRLPRVTALAARKSRAVRA